jgi:hypothetical protein
MHYREVAFIDEKLMSHFLGFCFLSIYLSIYLSIKVHQVIIQCPDHKQKPIQFLIFSA